MFFSGKCIGGSQSNGSISPSTLLDVTCCAQHSSLGQMQLKRKIRLNIETCHCVYFTKCQLLFAG